MHFRIPESVSEATFLNFAIPFLQLIDDLLLLLQLHILLSFLFLLFLDTPHLVLVPLSLCYHRINFD